MRVVWDVFWPSVARDSFARAAIIEHQFFKRLSPSLDFAPSRFETFLNTKPMTYTL